MPRPPTTPISRTKWATLFSEQGGCCAGCFKPLGEDVHVDHVTPLACGGEDRFENLQLMHAACNAAKSDMRPEAWFRRSWLQLQAEQRKVDRTQVTVTLDPQVAERLRFAAELARKSMSALIDESLAATLVAAGMRRNRPGPRHTVAARSHSLGVSGAVLNSRVDLIEGQTTDLSEQAEMTHTQPPN